MRHLNHAPSRTRPTVKKTPCQAGYSVQAPCRKTAGAARLLVLPGHAIRRRRGRRDIVIRVCVMPEVSGLMRGKRGLIMGVANARSLAWGIAKACRGHGAELAFTYQGDALKKRVEPLAQEVGGIVVGDCDVTEPATIDAVFAAVKSAWGGIDFLVHAIAFSDKGQLDGRYVDTTADNFTKTMLISCYSFTAIAQRAEKMMPNGGAMLTLTYYGSEKWMPHYNVMGVAKSALE